MVKTSKDIARNFMTVVEMSDATGSEKIVSALSIVAQLLIEIRDSTNELNRRIAAEQMFVSQEKL